MVGEFTARQGCPNAARSPRALTAGQEHSAVPAFHHTRRISVVLRFTGDEQPVRLQVTVHRAPLWAPRAGISSTRRPLSKGIPPEPRITPSCEQRHFSCR